MSGDERIAVLVDLNNVSPRANTRETLEDVLDLVGSLIRRVVAPPAGTHPRDAVDVDCRLYDGWVARDGKRLEKHALSSVARERVLDGLRDGVRIFSVQATSLACAPGLELKGTYMNGGQKMVDQMLAQDLHFFCAQREYSRVLLIAGDEDYVPAVIMCSGVYGTSIDWLRPKLSSRNDEHLRMCPNLSLRHDVAWTRKVEL